MHVDAGAAPRPMREKCGAWPILPGVVTWPLSRRFLGTSTARGSYLVIVLLLAAAPAAAQDTAAAWAPDHRRIADVASTAAVVADIGLDTVASWRAPNRRRALIRQAIRIGGTIAASEAVKRLELRRRPDGSDRQSFWSEHTAIAAAGAGWSLRVAVPLTIGAGYLRMAADKHYPGDVGTGAAIGGIFAWFLR